MNDRLASATYTFKTSTCCCQIKTYSNAYPVPPDRFSARVFRDFCDGSLGKCPYTYCIKKWDTLSPHSEEPASIGFLVNADHAQVSVVCNKYFLAFYCSERYVVLFESGKHVDGVMSPAVYGVLNNDESIAIWSELEVVVFSLDGALLVSKSVDLAISLELRESEYIAHLFDGSVVSISSTNSGQSE